MSTLFGNNISQTYQGLIKLADSTTGVTATTQSLQDGLGNNIPIQVSTNTVNISGSLLVNGLPISFTNTGSFATTGSNTFIGNQTITGSLNISGYQRVYVAPGQDTVSVLVNSGSMGEHQIGLTVQPNGSTGLSFANKGNNFFQTNGNLIINSTIGGDGTGSISINVPSGSFNVTSPKVKINDGNITTTGSLIVSGSNNKLIGNINSTSIVNTIIGRTVIQGGDGGAGGATPRLIISGSDNIKTTFGRQFISIDATQVPGFGANITQYGDETSTVSFNQGVYNPNDYSNDVELYIITTSGGTQFQDYNSTSYEYEDFLVIPPNVGNSPAPQFTRGLDITGSLNITGSLLVNGVSFSSGTSGTSGSNGSSGTSGVAGSSGTSGSNGSSGTSGFNGTDGSSGTSGLTDKTGLITTGSQGITQNILGALFLSSSVPIATSSFIVSGSINVSGYITGSRIIATNIVASTVGGSSMSFGGGTSTIGNVVTNNAGFGGLSISSTSTFGISATTSLTLTSQTAAGVVITGSLSGTVYPLTIASSTASLNLSSGSYYTLQLVPAVNTFVNVINIKRGQTVNIELATTGSGTVSFSSNIKQISGASYVPTTTTGTDVIQLMSFSTSSMNLINVNKNLV